MMMKQARRHIHDRVDALPDTILACEACGLADTMNIRRSSLRDEPCADDITLKCGSCYHARAHGVPISRAEYEKELPWRDGRTLDFVDDGPGPVESNLEALGYVEY